ncbi:MAG: hypothetical protein Q9222_007717 [Ikaeria aurantiellina]
MAIPWDQTPEFLRTSDRTIHPGGPTRYTWQDFKRRPKVKGNRAARLPPEKKLPNGEPMYEQWPEEGKKTQVLLDFKHLPDQIGTNEYWWVFEAWRRLDPRIRWRDIWMRQKAGNRTLSSTGNSIEMLVSRSRKHLAIVAWEPQNPNLNRHRRQSKNQRNVQEKLTPWQIANNTTRGLTPGLRDPALGEAGGRIPWPKMAKGAGKHKGPQKARQQNRTRVTSRIELESSSTDEDESSDDDQELPIPKRHITARQMDPRRYAAATSSSRETRPLLRPPPPGQMRRIPESRYSQDRQLGFPNRRTFHPRLGLLDEDFRSLYDAPNTFHHPSDRHPLPPAHAHNPNPWTFDPSIPLHQDQPFHPIPPQRYFHPPAQPNQPRFTPFDALNTSTFTPPLQSTAFDPSRSSAPSALFGPPITYTIRRSAAPRLNDPFGDDGSGVQASQASQMGALQAPPFPHIEAPMQPLQLHPSSHTTFGDHLNLPHPAFSHPTVPGELEMRELFDLSPTWTPGAASAGEGYDP